MCNNQLINQKFFHNACIKEGKYILAGGKCSSCQKVMFPIRMACPFCGQQQIEEIPLSKTGTIYTYTWIHAGPMAFDPPYAIGYIDLPDGIRIFSLIKGKQKKLHAGMPVQLIVEPLNKEDNRLAYKFAPISDANQEECL